MHHQQIETPAKELLGTYAPWLTGMVPCTALAVLWLATFFLDYAALVITTVAVMKIC